jgi:hypothetical protein
MNSTYICEPRSYKLSFILSGLCQVPVHLSYGFVDDLRVVCPLLSIEMGGTGLLPHPLVRQLGEVDSETGRSLGIRTEAFHRRETRNVKGRSLMKFHRYGSELTKLGDHVCRTAWWLLRLSSLWSSRLPWSGVGTDHLPGIRVEDVEVPDEIEQLAFAFGG